MEIIKKNIIILVLLIIGFSCDSPDIDQLSDDFIVSTNYDPEANFSNYSTYVISDTIALFSNDPDDTILDSDAARPIISAIRANMSERGFQFAERNANPDLGVIVYTFSNVNLVNIPTGYWWNSPGWYWDPYYFGGYGYGYGYPYYYYPYSYTYAYQNGGLMVEIVDLKSYQQNNNRYRVLWSMYAGGVLSGNDERNIDQSVSAVHQAFTQSPIISRGE